MTDTGIGSWLSYSQYHAGYNTITGKVMALPGVYSPHLNNTRDLLVYLPPEDATVGAVLEEFRAGAGRRTGCPTMLGYGPRYLHSTGQLHKGGPNNGVFLIVTAEPAEDLPIPRASRR